MSLIIVLYDIYHINIVTSFRTLPRETKSKMGNKLSKHILMAKAGALAMVMFLMHTDKVEAQDGEQVFNQNCTACHKMGTRLVGPDLTGVTERRTEEWVKKFITNSQAMVQAGDADAVAIFEEFNKIPMTSFPLSDAELTAVVGYLSGFGAAAVTAAAPAAAVVAEAPIEYTAEDVAAGRAYFQGGTRLSGGGPSCISCHNVTASDQAIPGGLMAKDLTNAFSRMGGHAGVAGILGAPPFPAMTNSYAGSAAITEAEVHALAAFLKNVDEGSDVNEAGTEGQISMLAWGFIGLIAIFIWVALVWRVRLRQPVKEDVLKRQLKSI
jgi:mono/diheme cytochrome c family protein